MATRPIFVPETDPDRPQLVHENEVDFQWTPGDAPDQKMANITRLHDAAAHRNLSPLLEVSSFTADPLGSRLAVTQLTVKDEDSYYVPVRALYHGSMVFLNGGPFTDLYRMAEGEFAVDPRLKGSGRLAGFRFKELEWGVKAESMFYDWLVVHAIHRRPKLNSGILKFAGFTDIDCTSQAGAICHARSCALYVALAEKKIIDEVLGSQDLFIETLIRDPLYQS